MSVSLTPNNSLKFKGPFTERSECRLIIRNQHALATTFKVKTTNQKRYYVRPNGARIEPGGSVEVLVGMIALSEEPAPGAVCKDKFLVESSLIPARKKFQCLRNITGYEENTQPPEIHKQKLRVEYLPADSKSATKDGASQVSTSALDPNLCCTRHARQKSIAHILQASEAEPSYSPTLQDTPPAYSASQHEVMQGRLPERGLNSVSASTEESLRIAELSAQVEAAHKEIERLKATVETMSLAHPESAIKQGTEMQ